MGKLRTLVGVLAFSALPYLAYGDEVDLVKKVDTAKIVFCANSLF